MKKVIFQEDFSWDESWEYDNKGILVGFTKEGEEIQALRKYATCVLITGKTEEFDINKVTHSLITKEGKFSILGTENSNTEMYKYIDQEFNKI